MTSFMHSTGTGSSTGSSTGTGSSSDTHSHTHARTRAAWAWALVALAVAALALGGCRGRAQSDDGALRVVATTTMLADLARHLAPEAVHVESLIPPGADPHTWQPRPTDARRVRDAHVVVRNGLYLEGWIDRLIEHAGGEPAVITAAARVTPRADPDDRDGADPHFWFDVALWITAADEIHAALRPHLDPGLHAELDARHAAHTAELRALDAWVRERVATVPAGQRVLVTSHDAFGYFGAAYGIEVHGIQGMSTGQEASQRDVLEVVRRVRERELPAVFLETSVPPALLRQVASETGARVAGPLYSDSLGPEGSDGTTYVAMVRANVRQIVEALGGEFIDFAAGASEATE